MIRPHDPFCDIFLKIGGSILDNVAHTAALAADLVTLSGDSRVILLPGGGRVAKRIKANQSERGCDFDRCWRATTLALDVNAGLLASHSPRFRVSNSIAQIMESFEIGSIPIFAPADALFSSLWFTPNWVVTTDTMGLYFAHTMGAHRYVIVTDVDGICECAPISGMSTKAIPRIDVGELERLPSSKLDAAFPGFFRRYPMETIVVNGKFPSRVLAAVSGQRTAGTEITKDANITPVNGHGTRFRADSPTAFNGATTGP
jgi:aspartokinase-like uncharacterized kinase